MASRNAPGASNLRQLVPPPQPDAVLAEMDKVLANERFATSPRLIRFLTYAIGESLAGRSDRLKENELAVHVFDRGGDFDAGLDPIVRVHVSKLRAKLQDYYEHEGSTDSLRIEFPKGSYVPRFTAVVLAPEETSAPGAAPGHKDGPASSLVALLRRKSWIGFGAAAAVTALAVVSAWTWFHERRPETPLVLTQLSYEAGLAMMPAVSRDGRLIVYSSAESEDEPHLWIRRVRSGGPVQLTHADAADISPDFSPDGALVVFRSHRHGGGIYVVPSLGGPDRQVADNGWRPRFSPDGAWIAYQGDHNGSVGLFTVPTVGGKPREVSTGDVEVIAAPMWTPRGKHLLFLGAPRGASTAAPEYDWYAVPWTGGTPIKVGLREQLRAQRAPEIDGETRPGDWVGNHVVFSLRRDTAAGIWKVPLNLNTLRVSGKAIQLTNGSATEIEPRSTASGQVVFASEQDMTYIVSLRIDGKTGKAIGAPEKVVADLSLHSSSTFPRLSADGRKLAFVSNRAEGREAWIKDLDTGENAILTAAPRPQDVPLVSGDGSLLLYGSGEQGGYDIYAAGPGKPFAQRACERCGIPQDWSGDGSRVLVEAPSRSALIVWDSVTGTRREWLKYPARSLRQASLSADGHWVALTFSGFSGGFVAPITSSPASREQLVPVASAPELHSLNWSPDGNTLYYFSRLDDHRCLWAQPMDPETKRPLGPPSAVYHFHSRRLAPWGGWISIGAGRMVFALTEPRSTIWLGQNGPEKPASNTTRP
jgi:hypothetical protein